MAIKLSELINIFGEVPHQHKAINYCLDNSKYSIVDDLEEDSEEYTIGDLENDYQVWEDIKKRHNKK